MEGIPDLTRVRQMANKAVAFREALDAQLEDNRQETRRLEEELAELDMVGSVLRQLIDAEVIDGVKAVEKLQTEGLQEIFHDQPLSVRADIGESRGKVSVNFLTQRQGRDGTLVEGLVDQSFGGSVLTIQSILMRVTLIYRRKMRPLLLLDETLAAVANRYVDRAGRFLGVLCDHGLDVLLITHDEALVGVARRAYKVVLVNDKAEVREVTSEN